VRFCPWYPLADAASRAPTGEGVLQLRLAEGLVNYPHGKSAMVCYALADDLREAVIVLAKRHADRRLLCRHLEIPAGTAVDLPAFYAKVLDDFLRRFGSPPALPP
jgi:hypothetical protein